MRLTSLILLIVLFSACRKGDTAPTITLKSGSGYTSANVSASPGAQLLVRVVADKGTDNLELFYTEVAYDGANTNRLVSRVYLGPNDEQHYERDVTVTLRSQAGTERWIFNVNDSDGRISKTEIRVTVQ